MTLKLIILANKNMAIAYFLSKFITIYLTQSCTLQNAKNNLQKNAEIAYYLLKYINIFLLEDNILNAQKNDLQKRSIIL